MKLIYQLLVLTLFVGACNSKKKCATNYDELLILCDSLDDSSIYFDRCIENLPYGLSDTLILGYTDMRNGFVYDTLCEYASLHTEGYHFSNQKKAWNYYSFTISDETEQKSFASYVRYSENFFNRTQNPSKYFQIDGNWYLRYLPSP